MTKRTKAMRGKTLKDIVESSGYTMVKFAEETGISVASLHCYMKGQKQPSIDKVLIIAKTLKISLKRTVELLGKDVTGIPNDN